MAVPIDFEALLASSPNSYVLFDRELKFVWMNEAYLRITGRSRDELIGKGMFEAFPSPAGSESHRQLDHSFRRVLKTGETDELALIRYDITRPDGNPEERYWSATHSAIRDERGSIRYILQHTVDVTELHGLRTLRNEVGIVQRAHAVQARNLDLAEESHQLKALFEQAPGFAAITIGPDHVFQLANRAYSRLVGGRKVVGKTVAEALPEIVDQGFVGLLDGVMSSGIPYVAQRALVLLQRADGAGVEERFLDFIFQPILGESGPPTGVFVQGHDVTEQVEAEERQKLLINELNHRVKNMLAIIQGLSMQTFRQVSGAGPALNVFNARLNALAAAHSLLTSRNWKAAGLLDTIRGAVEATAGSDISRVHLAGPDFTLAPQAAVSLAMIIHELSTNAIKYGALSNDTGRLDISWTIEEEANGCALTVDWVESGGPPAKAPDKSGFGTRLIRRGISAERRSDVRLDFAPEGLRCSIRALLPKVRS